MENYSLADIRAATEDRRDDYDGFGGGWFWIVVLFLFMFGFGGNGFNRSNEGNAIQADIQRGFDTNAIVNKLDSISNGICNSSYENARLINGLETQLCNSFSNTNAAIAENRFASQQCCCETNRNIDAVRYENSNNTRDITTAIHAEGEATRALIQSNTVQDLRDRLEARDRDLLTANFQLSQQAQSASLISTLRPFPQPSYITCSPYQAVNTTCGCTGLGCGCGCA